MTSSNLEEICSEMHAAFNDLAKYNAKNWMEARKRPRVCFIDVAEIPYKDLKHLEFCMRIGRPAGYWFVLQLKDCPIPRILDRSYCIVLQNNRKD